MKRKRALKNGKWRELDPLLPKFVPSPPPLDAHESDDYVVNVVPFQRTFSSDDMPNCALSDARKKFTDRYGSTTRRLRTRSGMIDESPSLSSCLKKEIGGDLITSDMLFNHVAKSYYSELDYPSYERSHLNAQIILLVDVLMAIGFFFGLYQFVEQLGFRKINHNSYPLAVDEAFAVCCVLCIMWALYLSIRILRTRTKSKNLWFYTAIYLIFSTMYLTQSICRIYDYTRNSGYEITVQIIDWCCCFGLTWSVCRMYEMKPFILHTLYILGCIGIFFWNLYALLSAAHSTRLSIVSNSQIFTESKISLWLGLAFLFVYNKVNFWGITFTRNTIAYYFSGYRVFYMLPLFIIDPSSGGSSFFLVILPLYVLSILLYLIRPLRASARYTLVHTLKKDIAEFSFDSTFECCRLAQYVYTMAATNRTKGCCDNDIHFHCMVIDSTIHIVFRGTDGKKNKNTNLNWHLTEITEEAFPGCESFKQYTRIHRGFHEAYIAVRKYVHQEISKIKEAYPDLYKRSNFVICGHSMGGALAILCALDLSLQYKDDITVYSFGSPRVGNIKFKLIVDERVSRIYRIVHDNDACTSIPTRAQGFRHVGTEVWINSHGEIKFDPSYLQLSILPFRLSLHHHSVASYIQALKLVVTRILENPHARDQSMAELLEEDRVFMLLESRIQSLWKLQ